MQSQTTHENITLYYREGSSDKVYQAAIVSSGEGFIVNFAYGRRGSNLSTGTKTASPVTREQAKKIYDKLVQEKTAKGYTPGEDGTRYSQAADAQRSTGIVPQLLNPIDDADAEKFITDDRWWMQEKFDGRRVLIRKSGQEVTGINRNGLTIGLSLPIVQAVQLLGAADCLLDGEAIGDVYYAFDLLQRDGIDITSSPYAERYAAMAGLVEGRSPALRCAQSAAGTANKRLLLDTLKRLKKEGVVFKDSSAHYAPGRPASGGSQVKFKFYATASCIVAGINGSKRSVALELIDGDKRVGVGNVTISGKHAIPAPTTVVEVRYLYAYSGGSLYQPVYLGPRDDVTHENCQLSQLKLRAEGEDEI